MSIHYHTYTVDESYTIKPDLRILLISVIITRDGNH
jgi:hypothetical protein